MLTIFVMMKMAMAPIERVAPFRDIPPAEAAPGAGVVFVAMIRIL